MDVLVAAVTLASIYGLLGVGISLTWAGLGFLNLAHGATFTAAGYGAWWASKHISSSGAVTVVAGVVMGAIAGAIVCAVVFIPLEGRPNWPVRSMIASLALSIIGTNVYLQVFGPRDKPLPLLFGTSKFTIGGYNITSDRSGAIICSAVVMALIVVALSTTRMGLAVRALTQSSEGAALVGIGRKQAAFAILMVSGALAGFAVVLLSQVYYVSPNAGFVPLVKGLIVALLGGLGSVWGAVVAGLLVGATDAVTARYLNQDFVLLTLFGLIAIVLLIRPRGVAGLLETSRA
jgi:branched-chain amino acid transport system permease protein